MLTKKWNKYNLEVGQIYGCYTIVDIGPFFIQSQPNRGHIKVRCNECNREYLKRRDVIYRPPKKCRNCANKDNVIKNQQKGLINRKGYSASGHRGVGDLSKTQFLKFKNSAKKRNIPWSDEVTIEYLWDLFLEQKGRCALSGLEVKITGDKHQPITNKNGNINTDLNLTASLDRIDSSKGYEIGNLQWLHVRVNFMKNVYDQEEFINIATKIALTQKRKKYE